MIDNVTIHVIYTKNTLQGAYINKKPKEQTTFFNAKLV